MDDPFISSASPQKPDPPEMAAWKRWKSSPSTESMASAVKALSPQIDAAISANPGLSPRLVRSKAKGYVVRAIKSFDPSSGASLATHATNYLKPLARRGHTMLSASGRSRHFESTRGDYKKSFEDFVEQYGREPSHVEMAGRLKISGDLSKKMMGEMNGYEMPEGGIEGSVGVDKAQSDLDDWVEYLHAALPDRDKIIIDYRLGRNGRPELGIEDIASRVGMSPAGVFKVINSFSQRLNRELDQLQM